MNETQLDGVIERLLSFARNCEKVESDYLTSEEIKFVTSESSALLLKQDILLRLDNTFVVCGDVRGNIQSVWNILHQFGMPDSGNYIFLGNYVSHITSPECFLLLLSLKLKYPDNIYLLRGSNDTRSMSRFRNFYFECKRRYNIKIWKLMTITMNCLPLAAILGGKIFCVHGGVSPNLKLSKIEEINRPTEMEYELGPVYEMLWCDPMSSFTDGWFDGGKGIGYSFGCNEVTKFLSENDLSFFCRSHEVVDGYEYFANKTFVTIFSTVLEEFYNKAAVIIFEHHNDYNHRIEEICSPSRVKSARK